MIKLIVTVILALIILAFICCSAAYGQKVGLDRIDAAVGASASGDWPRILAEKTASTGVKHVKIWVPWDTVNAEPPFSVKPRGGREYLIVPCFRTMISDSECWHRYRIKELDQAIQEAENVGLTVTLGIHGPPRWPRGERVCDYDWGTVLPCGIIQQSHYGKFRDALYDFTFYMSGRYPQIEYWILYNEPNLPYAFLPEKPYPGAGTLLDAYMFLIYEPMKEALRETGGSFHKLVGPEITAQDVENEFGNTRWMEDWILPILEHFPNSFDVISVHSYTVDAHQTLEKMERFSQALKANPLATQRVWLTEFDFGTDKESLTRTDANRFLNLLVLYSNQWWERSFYFSMMGNLVSSKHDSFGQEKPLYHLFKVLVENLD